VIYVIDNWSRQSLLLKVGFRLTGSSVVQALNCASNEGRLPQSITVDHGPEFTSLQLDAWAHLHGVILSFTRPGKPTDNGLCESFNGRSRDKCLKVHNFNTIEDAKQIIEQWRRDYSQNRPHSSLGNLTPNEYKLKGQKTARMATSNSPISGRSNSPRQGGLFISHPRCCAQGAAYSNMTCV
jgi:putative transposase